MKKKAHKRISKNHTNLIIPDTDVTIRPTQTGDDLMKLYATAVRSGYIYVKEGEDTAQKYIDKFMSGYKIIPSLSDDYSLVLYDPQRDDIIVSYRGTIIQGGRLTAEDLKADAEVALSMPKFTETTRLAQADEKFQRTRFLFPNSHISVVGHSLGATQSYHVATKNNIPGYHFALGSSPLDYIFNTYTNYAHRGEQAYRRQVIYHAENKNPIAYTAPWLGMSSLLLTRGQDPISMASTQLPGTHITVPVNTITDFGAHFMGNFNAPSADKINDS